MSKRKMVQTDITGKCEPTGLVALHSSSVTVALALHALVPVTFSQITLKPGSCYAQAQEYCCQPQQ